MDENIQKDRLKQLMDRAERSDRKLDLIQHCTKISQGLEKLPSNSGDRAIWELIQNVCDLAKSSCRVRMTLNDGEFVFAHQGAPFTYETLSSLIRQVSSSVKQVRAAVADTQPTIGQYGTGFITTHIFGRVIEIKGSLDVSLDGESPSFVDLSDKNGRGFIINREFDDVLEFVDKMSDQIGNAQKLLQKTTLSTCEEWTELHYRLTNNAYEVANNALVKAVKLMPYVMAFNPKLSEVEIISSERDSIRISRLSAKDEYVDNYLIEIVSIGITGHNNLDVYCLCSEDKSQVTIIPPTILPPVDETPSLFLYYPLIGSEQFGINFIFHSARFEATELRDGIMLPSCNANTKRKYEQNVRELMEMTSRLLEFLSSTTDTRFSLCHHEQMARVTFPIEGIEDEELAAFYKLIRSRYVDAFVGLPLFVVGNDKVRISSGTVKMIDPELITTLMPKDLGKYESALLNYVKQAGDIPDYKPIEWSRIVNEWATGNGDYFISCESICESIENNSDDLLTFVNLLNETGHTSMLNKYALIPNRDGVLLKAENLKVGRTINGELYLISKPLLGDKAQTIVNDTFKDVYPFGEYSRRMLRDDVSAHLMSVKKHTIDEGHEFDGTMVAALLKFCSYYPNENNNSFRARIMPFVCKLYDAEYDPLLMQPAESNEVDLYETPFGYLIDSVMIHIAQKSALWVKENEELLHGFLRVYASVSEMRWEDKLKKYAVVPNQNYELCIAENLFKNADVDDTLIEYYQKVLSRDVKDRLVLNSCVDVFSFPEETAKNVSQEIQSRLESEGFQNRILIDIIERLEDNQWEGLFSSIYNQRESIRYNLGSKDEKRQINRLLRHQNEALLATLANVAEKEHALEIIQLGEEAWKNSQDEQYIKWLGSYVEKNLLRYLHEKLSGYDVVIRDEQGGQDYILSKKNHEDYRIEVKSRWSTDDSVEMSALQVQTAVENPTRYALLMVNMNEYDRESVERDDQMSDGEIECLVKVVDNIGEVAKEAYESVSGVFENHGDVSAEGSYKFRVLQSVFKKRNLGIEEFVGILKKKFE